MSSTQPLTDESVTVDIGNSNKYGYLVVDGKWHEIKIGETKIGRDPSLCSIALEDFNLSKIHAVIESEGPEDSFIYDSNSANKTKIGKMTLKPQCRYKINDNDTIVLGSKVVQYKIINHKIDSSKLESPSDTVIPCKSDGEMYISIKNKCSNVCETDLSTKETNTSTIFQRSSLQIPIETLNKQKNPYYIMASELFNTDIFSQATQCEVTDSKEKSENFKNKTNELADICKDVFDVKTQCSYFADADESKIKLNNYEASSEKTNKITESYLDESGSFDFVKRNKSKHFSTPLLCKSIGDDIFEIQTQCQLKVNDSPEVSVKKDQNFKDCFSSKLLNNEKTEEQVANVSKTISKTDASVIRANNLNLRDIDSQFFNYDKDEELCELMRAISPQINQNDNCIFTHSKKLPQNDRLDGGYDPDDIFDIATQFSSDLSSLKNVSTPISKTEKCKIKCEKNEEGKKLMKTEQKLKHSKDTCSKTEVTKTHNRKCISHKRSKGKKGKLGNKKSANDYDKITNDLGSQDEIENQKRTKNFKGKTYSQVHSPDSSNIVRDHSQNAFLNGRSNENDPVSLDNSLSIDLDDKPDSHLDSKLGSKDSYKIGDIKSPLLNETLNEVWEKQGNCSPASSSKTLSDLDVAEFQGNSVSAPDNDVEVDFIATQASSLVDKSKPEELYNKMESASKEGKTDQDVWNGNWQGFIFTTKHAHAKSNRSESDSTDKTDSDVVVSCKPIENYEITEISSEDDIYNIEDESSFSTKDDLEEIRSESPVLLQSNIPMDYIQDEEEGDLSKTAEKSFIKECDANKSRVVSDSDETDCEEELKARKVSVVDKFDDIGDNLKADEILPSTSIIQTKEEKAKTDDVLYEKREDSPLKRTRRSEAEVSVAKKRSKNLKNKKENVNVGERQLRKRGARVCKEKFKTEEEKGNDEVKNSHRKRVVNSNIATRKKLEFIREGNLHKISGPKIACSESKWKPSIVKIVFTGFESESHNRIITKLGGTRVNDFDEGNVLVTDKVRRTVKFLSAVALGLPIVSPKWLMSSNKEQKFLDPWNFLLEDQTSEERWGFNLRSSLENWKKEKLLKGFNVFATENTKPPVPEILSIVECCGGVALTSSPETWPENSIVLTCLEDKKLWPHYKYRSVKIVHYEFLLSGVLKHRMDFETYKLR